MVLDIVVSATWEELGDLGPLIAELIVELDDLAVLLISPLVLLDVGVEVVVPPRKESERALTFPCTACRCGRGAPWRSGTSSGLRSA